METGMMYGAYSVSEVKDECARQELTYDELVFRATCAYLGEIDVDMPPSPVRLKSEILDLTNACVDLYNLGEEDVNAPPGAKASDRFPFAKTAGDRFRKGTMLLPVQVALVIHRLHRAVCVCWSGGDDDGNYDVGVYQSDGANEGCYDVSSDCLERLVRRYNFAATNRDVAETVSALRAICPRAERCTDRDLVAVNNGVFDYKRKILMPFDPDYVFTSKSHVDYVDGAVNPVIHNDDDGTDWDVESWMSELSDDPEVVELLWEILGAIIRPNVSWNKTAWFYSTLGNNGKGTLCVLMRNLCGAGAWASIPLKAFSKEFMLEPLTRVSAVITDENDTGTFVDDAAALKSIITQDPFQINRKFKDPRTLMFHGFMVQCVNELPRLRDRSESMYRRLTVVPFDKRFEGRERKYIKSDYLQRREVLEYALYRVLHDMTYYELSEPEACRDMLDEYRIVNDPVRQFCEDALPKLSWDAVSWEDLYKLYRGWFAKHVPSGNPLMKPAFLRDVKRVLMDFADWDVADNAVSTAGKCDYPEPLIIEYDVRDMRNRRYLGSDPSKVCTPDVPKRIRGIVRAAGAFAVRRDVSGCYLQGHDPEEGNEDD